MSHAVPLRFVVPIVGALALCAPSARAADGESSRLHALLERAWQSKLDEHPEFATYIGFPGHNHLWTDNSPAGIARREASTREQLAAARAIDRQALAAPDQLDLDLFVRRLEGQVDGSRFPDDEVRITAYGGVQQDVPFALARSPAASVRDFEDLVARLNAIPELVEQHLALLEKGRAAGVTSPKSQMQAVPDQVRALVPEDPWQSPLLAPFRAIGSALPAPEAERLRAAALGAYRDRAAPAFRKLLQYLTTIYVPAARDSIGMGALPDGAAWYAHRLRLAITRPDADPRQVHERGLAEVRRIRAAMDELIASTGFKGSFAEFVAFLHRDPRFFAAKSEELVDGYRAIAQKVAAKLPALFGALPTLRLEVLPVPDAEAPGSTTLYYAPGSVAYGRAGTCFVNTFDLRGRPKWEMTALSLHECMPGHHLQVTTAQSLPRPPRVLNYHDYTPYVEGWGVYAETLGDEMGLYGDPYVKFGQLSSEMWRALRVVVDTGIHSQGWTRAQAVAYFRDNTAQDQRAIDNEIERYIYEPGLGVAYTWGELELKELRAFAQQQLGAAFDVRAFHDEILRQGAMPLDMLDARLRAWVAARKAEAKPAPAGP